MTGSDKADGYSRDVFIGLNDRERDIVFDLLAKELPWSAKWLFFFDIPKALSIAKKTEEELRGDKYSHVYLLQEKIVEYSGDLEYQLHMLEDYPSHIERLKPRVIDAIRSTPTTPETIQFLKEVVFTETSSSALARAIRGYLDAMKIPLTTESEKLITVDWKMD
jgi:hypothetical protein